MTEPQSDEAQLVQNAAAKTIALEAQALDYLSQNLPPDLEPAIHHILNIKGRVIVSGIGKSGHIGRKIAATLASTGTPAFFVHCAEASHGDLGMVTNDDICLLISNSGETTELRDMLFHVKRFSIPMIGISSKPDSTVMRAANYRLTLPALPEACPIGMAPTTSTTLTLALGDALAVALMELRGFMPEDFRLYHPGGKLGEQLKTVTDFMHGGDSLPLLDHQADIQTALLTMTSKGFGVAILMDGPKLAGVMTDGDLRRNMDKLLQVRPIEIANHSPVTVHPDMLAAEALALMNARKISVLVAVASDGTPVGIVHIHDFLRAGVM
ncbi:MAG: KpsF/GutQ family sugar-phosphate isomerase [Rhodobacteraceae bacterium]|nr:KpsF/GutQ family sugar-phosphate isomerase [Paracoccaceae bacterium]